MTTTPEATVAPEARSTRRDALVVVAVGVAYFLAHQLAFLYPDAQRVLMALWPAGGIGLASLLLAPRRLWPAIVITMFVVGNAANVIEGRPFLASLGFMTANVAESLGCAWLIIALCGSRVRFGAVREVLALIGGTTLVNAATACLGAAVDVLVFGSPFAGAWRTWFVADGLGILLVTPLVVAWAERACLPVNVRWGRVAESTAFTAIWCAAAWLAFQPAGPAHPDVLRPYLLFALLPWVAYRFGQRGTALALVGVAAFIITGASVRIGPSILGGATVAERLLLVQLFLAVLGAAGLLLAASFTESKQAAQSTRDAHDRLRALGDNIPEGMLYQLVREPDGTMYFTSVSAGAERVTGVSADAMLKNYAAFFQRVHEEDRERFRAIRESSVGSLRPVHDVFRFRHPDGQVRRLQISSAPRQLADGRVQWDGAAIDVTERIAAERAAEEEAHRRHILFAQSFDGIAVLGLDGSVVEANESFARMLGYTPEEAQRLRVWDWNAEWTREQLLQNLRELSVRGATFETRHRRKDGTLRDVELSASGAEIGGQMLVHCLYRDVTERKHAAETLRESEARLRLAAEAAAFGVYAWDFATSEAYYSPSFLALYGLSPDATIDLDADLVPRALLPEDKAAWRASVNAADDPRGTGALEHEYRIRRADGEVRWLRVRGQTTFAGHDPDALPLRAHGIILDITERKRAEQALEEGELRFKAQYQSLPTPTFTWRKDGDDFELVGANDAASAITGGALEEFVGRKASELYADRPDMLQDIERCFVGREVLRRETRSEHFLPGRFVIVTLAYVPPDLVMVHLEDITERKRAEEALAESHRVLEDVQEMAHLGSWEIDLGTRTMVASPEAHRVYGIPDGVMTLAAVQGVALPEYRPLLDAAFAALLADGARYSVEYKIRRPSDGAVRHMHSVAEYDAARRRVTGFIQDITDRKRAEEENRALQARLFQSQKIESVGRLAGGVAHDFNNAVQTILLNTEMALVHSAEGTPLRRYLADIRTSAQHSAGLTAQLLTFARKQTAQPRVLDLNTVIAALLPLLQRLIGEDITTVWAPGAGLWPVRADPIQLDQILTNLAVNARDAVVGVGRLALATANVTVDAGLAATHPDLAPGDFVRLTVADDGCGMDAETLAHIFEPFFTTKPVGAGTGLGLATVHGIVSQNGGAVTVESTPGGGSTFAIWLPRVEAPEVQPPAPPDAAAPRRGTETILLVEDAVALLRAAGAILSSFGYTVLAANRPGAALRTAEAHDGPIHLLVTDVVMPEMNGRVLANRLAATRPALKRLYVSGYANEAIGPRGIIEAESPFLAKPFTADALARKVREVLDGGDRG